MPSYGQCTEGFFKGASSLRNCFLMVDGPGVNEFKDTLIASQDPPPLTRNMHKCAHNIWPPGSRCLPHCAPKVSSWCPRSCWLVCWQKLTTSDQTETSRAQGGDFQCTPWQVFRVQPSMFWGTRWQPSGPWGPNILSTFMSIAGSWMCLGKEASQK